MASMRDIQRRKKSIQSTGQITKAMKLVSTVKLQKAKVHAEKSNPYFTNMFKIVKYMIARSGHIESSYLNAKNTDKKAVILISSNKGLAGGYNANIAKVILQNSEIVKESAQIYAVGRKARDVLARNGFSITNDYSEVIENPMYSDAMDICADVLDSYKKGEVGEIYIAYTAFKNTVTHIPTLTKLLPVSKDEYELTEEEKLTLMNYEPEEEDALEIIIPKYITSIIYGGLMESLASENGARMAAMDSATTNAEELIDDLALMYNRARQSSITQELTEIIAGAEAIGS